MKKLFVIAALFAAAAVQATTITGFTGAYGVGNWTTDFTPDCSGCLTVHSPSQLTLTGADDPNAVGAADQFVTRLITVPTDATITFNWQYTTADDDPFYDPFGVVTDDGSGILFTQLSDDHGGSPQSGTRSFVVDAGDVFGFRVWSVDSLTGAATGIITDFSVESVPEPASLALVGIGMLGAATARRRRAAA